MVNGKQSTATLNGGLISVSDNGTAADKTDDVVLYSAPAGFSGADTFTYSITDGSGDAATATVTVTVGAAAPLAGPVNDTVSVAENSTNNVIDVMANDNLGVNGFGRMLIFSIDHLSASTTQGGTINLIDNGTPGDRTDDSISYTPAANFNGTDTFYYYLEVDGVEYQTVGVDAGMVTITVGTVAPVVATPTAVADVASVGFNSTGNVIDVLANDTPGSDGYINGGLTMTNGTLSSASTNGGLISVDNKNTVSTLDDEFLYSSPVGFSGTDTFSYTITDASGDASTGTVTVTVAALVVNTPTALNDAISVNEDSSNNVIDILANDDFGSDGAHVPPMSFSAGLFTNGFYIVTKTTTQGGTAEIITDSVIHYTPAVGFVGTDTFGYYIYDTTGDRSLGTVTVTVGTVAPVVSTPTAVDDNVSVVQYSLVNYINVLSNDSFGSDGPSTTHPLTLSNGRLTGTSAGNRSISVNNNGTPNDLTDDTIQYSPGSNATDSFTYTITDASGDATVGTVYITTTSSKSENSIDIGGNKILENEFLIYPNPTVGGNLRGTVLSSVNTKATISLIDINGKLIYRAAQDFNEGRNDLNLNINVKPGIMFLRITSPKVNYGTSKVIFK